MIESPCSPPRPPTAEVEISAPENGDDVPPCSTLNETLTFVIEQMPSLPLEAAEIIAEVTLSTIHKSNSIFKNKEAFLSFFKMS